MHMSTIVEGLVMSPLKSEEMNNSLQRYGFIYDIKESLISDAFSICVAKVSQ